VFTQIKRLCEEEGIKIRQLEQRAKIGNGVIAKWKKSSPQIDSLSKVAEYFNVSLDYLAGRTDVKNSNLKPIEAQELESHIRNLLNRLDTQSLHLNNEPIDVDVSEIIKKMLISDLEIWKFMNRQKGERNDI